MAFVRWLASCRAALSVAVLHDMHIGELLGGYFGAATLTGCWQKIFRATL